MQITLLDGGMGQELVARSGDEPTPLWATRVMIDHPGLVKAIHDDYFAAGASVATTNTYNILHDRLEGVGLDALYHALHLRALMEAHEAKAQAGRGIIAGSMGPLGESYRPDLTPARRGFRPALRRKGPDPGAACRCDPAGNHVLAGPRARRVARRTGRWPAGLAFGFGR